MSVIEMSIVLFCALTAAAAGLIFVSASRPNPSPARAPGPSGMFFLFRDLCLEDASPGADALITGGSGETDWEVLRSNLLARFPSLPDDTELLRVGDMTMRAAMTNDRARLYLTREDEMTRVSIEGTDQADPCADYKLMSLQAENTTLKLAAESAPYPIWMVDLDGAVKWANPAYQDLRVRSHDSDDAATPIFDIDPVPITINQAVRVPLKSGVVGDVDWFDVTATKSDMFTMFHAVDINAVIQADVAQRNFVQTLAKTFAQLPIGLAIFDRNGQLALFNPALVDLTSLPAEFLSARPDLLSFFDRLRENRVMPEPKNYATWRQEIANVIAAATNGDYEETWALETGHTYRVNGRPHPDGAVAFLIEDITAEIAMTRNFRAELELGQSMMDTFDDGIVVFSSAGILSFCNSAYRDVWKLDPDKTFADVTIVDSIKDWQRQSAPDPAWGDIRDFVMKVGERVAWDSVIEHRVHGELCAHVSPIISGATVIRFSAVSNVPAPSVLDTA